MKIGLKRWWMPLALIAMFAIASTTTGAAEGPDSDSISLKVANRKKGDWQGVIEYFDKFSPPEKLSENDLDLWDAYLYLRAETWLERSQQWTNSKAVQADARIAEQAAHKYLDWYRALGARQDKLPRTPKDSAFANSASPGRVRFGVAVFGNALLAQAEPDTVVLEFAKIPKEWIGIEVVRVWRSAATYEYVRQKESEVSSLDRVKRNLNRRPETRDAVITFTANVMALAAELAPREPSLPKDWNELVELCKAVNGAVQPPGGRQ